MAEEKSIKKDETKAPAKKAPAKKAVAKKAPAAKKAAVKPAAKKAAAPKKPNAKAAAKATKAARSSGRRRTDTTADRPSFRVRCGMGTGRGMAATSGNGLVGAKTTGIRLS